MSVCAPLPALAVEEKATLAHGITPADYRVLGAIAQSSASGEIASRAGMDPQELGRHIGHLIRHR